MKKMCGCGFLPPRKKKGGGLIAREFESVIDMPIARWRKMGSVTNVAKKEDEEMLSESLIVKIGNLKGKCSEKCCFHVFCYFL